MIKIAILIQAHRNPAQFARLCGRLKHENADIFVHIDLKSNIQPFKKLVPWVTYIRERVDVLWGDFSQIQATLNSLRQIQCGTTSYDYVLFISGQDYPIVPIETILEQLSASKSKGYIFGRKLTDSKEDFYTNRCYKYRYYALRNRFINKAVNKFIRIVSVVKRKYPYADVYKGSSWWCLTGDCVRYILDFCDRRQDYVKFHHRVCCGDEFFFQNIVVNSPFAEAELRDEQFHYVYMDWSAGRANPKTFTAADYERIAASGKWFVRKVDADLDSEIFDMLDK